MAPRSPSGFVDAVAGSLFTGAADFIERGCKGSGGMFSIEHMFVDEAEKAEPGDPPMARLKAIEDELAELCGLANAIHGRMVELVGDALDAELWGGWGIHSPQHWVGWQTSMAPTSVKALVALARRRRELPLTTAALSEGTVSLAQAALIARHVPGSYEKSVMEFAPHATVSQLQRNLPRLSLIHI